MVCIVGRVHPSNGLHSVSGLYSTRLETGTWSGVKVKSCVTVQLCGEGANTTLCPRVHD